MSPTAGPALASQTRYYWQVRVWDNDGNASAWSGPDAWFETAFLDPGQFQGSWIASPASMAGPELLLRKGFALGGQPISRARLYVAGLSYPYVSINGRPISDHVLDSTFTAYDKTVDYSTFDVTQLMRGGSNAIAVSLGNGFYAGGADDYPASGQAWQPAQPTLKLELEVWDATGKATRVLSDGSWKVATGPTTANAPDVESYDARLEKPGWTQTGYNDSGWAHDVVLPDANAPVPSYSGTPVADWIWNTAGASTSAPAGTIYLRKTFTVADPSSLSSALLRVNGDDGDQAYVNGTLVSSSSGTVVDSWQQSQVSDIKSLLVPGTNVIAIAGIANNPDASGVIATAQLDSTRIVTDGTWKALPGTPASPPAGWNTAGFDDSSWPTANVQGPYGMSPWGTNVRVVTGPAGVLRAQLIPPIEETATVNPAKTTTLPGATVPVPSYSATPVANWIWNTAGASTSAPIGTIYLRKTFTVADPSSLSSAALRVNGDDGDQAYVNGTMVSSSPGTVDNSWQNSQVSDIKSLLVPGTNVIAIAGIANQANASGVIAAAQLDSTRIVTDGTWKALPGTPGVAALGLEHGRFRRLVVANGERAGPLRHGPLGYQHPEPERAIEGLRLRDHDVRLGADHDAGHGWHPGPGQLLRAAQLGRHGAARGRQRPDRHLHPQGKRPRNVRAEVRLEGLPVRTGLGGGRRHVAHDPVGPGRRGAHGAGHVRQLHQFERPAQPDARRDDEHHPQQPVLLRQ